MFRAQNRAHHRSPSLNRRGAVSWPIVVMAVSLLLLAVLFSGLGRRFTPTVKPAPAPSAQPVPSSPLVVYCAASNRSVLEAIRTDYEAEFGTPVQVQYGGSQSLLASMDISKTGDLYLPADDSFFDRARERDLIGEVFMLAEMQAVVAVPKGNPLGIAKLDDLLREGVRVAQGNSEATAIGVVTKAALTATGQWDALAQRTTVFKPTVNDVANDVKIGSVDAGIVYDVVLHGHDTLEAVAIPELAHIRSKVGIALLKSSAQPTVAQHFARFISANDKGLVRYREYGFQPVDGVPWKNDRSVAP